MPQFRAKARAVDLLGKGQIADLPTAISELWKNGYDAYGDNLEAFLYMKGYEGSTEPIFVLSDDGKGMNEEDILDKWFVLGTDSKSRPELDTQGPETLNKEPRVKMGEKGIGRLAVAYLGPQMLMLTKKISCPLEIVFFDWRILSNYNLFISDINIPIRSISSLNQFEQAFLELKTEFLQNFVIPKTKRDPWKDQLDLKGKIISDCNELNIPNYLIEERISELIREPTKSHGTQFIIFKPEEQLIQLRDFIKSTGKDNTDSTSESYTVSTLAGLFNQFKEESQKDKTHFWIYENNDTGRYDLLTLKEFFTKADFNTSDHLIHGTFDITGEFIGEVRIYNKIVKHKFTPQTSTERTSYGPFNMKIGYVQQQEDVSILNSEQKRIFEEKLSLYSGMFIYRDGFRVLPYGRIDTDFLEFEERRSRSAGVYFFSKRRMFGYIEITRDKNGKLIDRSSREGFINNQAFRDFKINLIAFFKDLAKKYFATHAEYDFKEEQQGELKEIAYAEKQEQQRDIEARKEFVRKLNAAPKEIENLESEYNQYISELELKSKQASIAYDEIQQLVVRIEDCKVRLANHKISRPARFRPTSLQVKKFHDYNKLYTVTVQHFNRSSELLSLVRDKLKIQELFKEFEDKTVFFENTLSSFYRNFEQQLETVFAKIRNEFLTEKTLLLTDFEEKYKAIIPNLNDAQDIARSMSILESIFKDSQDRVQKRVTPYLDHLERLSFEVNEDNLVGYYKDQFEEMKKEWNQTYELAQLGIAVEIIDHQFNTLYSQMAENIKTLKPYLKEDISSQKRYKNLSNAFDHLQDNYKLLQPLYRTTGKIRKIVTGLEVFEYINEFFGSRLKDNNIEFTISEKGKTWSVNSYESIFKPVVINIVNNAIYWLQRSHNKEIRIDSVDDQLIIMNSGESIEDFLLGDIFKLFYSDRPKGRGIGLYLAKQSLNGIGYEIAASNDPNLNLLNGACFVIYPKNERV